jgi:rare lipoprotein A
VAKHTPLPPAPSITRPPKEVYVETGIASWYGPEFHGRRTSGGEVYDMNGLSAAHRTLPLHTEVLVENLDNGKALVVRVNDRGPFVEGRILDLSRGAAERLGVVGPGTARVRLTARGISPDAPMVFTLQVGAFAEPGNARRLREELHRRFGEAEVVRAETSRGVFHRVRVGRFATEAEARAAADQLRREGVQAHVVLRDE